VVVSDRTELGALALVEPAEDAAERGGHGGVQVEHARLLDAVGEEADDGPGCSVRAARVLGQLDGDGQAAGMENKQRP
jgi:hypothetical protein